MDEIELGCKHAQAGELENVENHQIQRPEQRAEFLERRSADENAENIQEMYMGRLKLLENSLEDERRENAKLVSELIRFRSGETVAENSPPDKANKPSNEEQVGRESSQYEQQDSVKLEFSISVENSDNARSENRSTNTISEETSLEHQNEKLLLKVRDLEIEIEQQKLDNQHNEETLQSLQSFATKERLASNSEERKELTRLRAEEQRFRAKIVRLQQNLAALKGLHRHPDIHDNKVKSSDAGTVTVVWETLSDPDVPIITISAELMPNQMDGTALGSAPINAQPVQKKTFANDPVIKLHDKIAKRDKHIAKLSADIKKLKSEFTQAYRAKEQEFEQFKKENNSANNSSKSRDSTQLKTTLQEREKQLSTERQLNARREHEIKKLKEQLTAQEVKMKSLMSSSNKTSQNRT